MFLMLPGDFDRLISLGNPALRLLGQIDPHGETRLDASQVQQLVTEVELLLTQARAGAERRGLMPLHTIAERRNELDPIPAKQGRLGRHNSIVAGAPDPVCRASPHPFTGHVAAPRQRCSLPCGFDERVVCVINLAHGQPNLGGGKDKGL
ncbi:hypothetical protein ACIA5D_27070 [Actinoplanes sp. NPDC051513]|uniref:hypothetical protein n=1 Tax=Actinoplanes sp. NPDC051513 TaxID=3363908 RepID=UPI0037AA85C6